MKRTLVLSLVLVIAACKGSKRNVPAKQGELGEVGSPLVVHPDIDKQIRYVRHSTNRTDDGRMTIALIIASRDDEDLVLVARTDWFDKEGAVVEQSAAHPILIASGQTYVYEDSSFSPDAMRFGVSLRPATTKRKK